MSIADDWLEEWASDAYSVMKTPPTQAVTQPGQFSVPFGINVIKVNAPVQNLNLSWKASRSVGEIGREYARNYYHKLGYTIHEVKAGFSADFEIENNFSRDFIKVITKIPLIYKQAFTLRPEEFANMQRGRYLFIAVPSNTEINEANGIIKNIWGGCVYEVRTSPSGVNLPFLGIGENIINVPKMERIVVSNNRKMITIPIESMDFVDVISDPEILEELTISSSSYVKST